MPVHLERPVASAKMKILAPFKKRYRDRVSISKFPIDVQILLVDTVQTDDGKLVFVKNSKAGCTTITKELYRYSKGHEYEGKIHRLKSDFRQGIEHHEENYKALFAPDTYKFAFVRDPQQRAISAFKDFFLQKRNPFSSQHREPIKAFGYDDNASTEKKFDIYLDYISASFETDMYRTDRHFRLQTLNIGHGIIDYDFIGRVESLSADMAQVFSAVGSPDIIDTDVGIQAHNRTNKVDIELSKSQLDRLEKLYGPDYETFDYI